MKKILVMLVTGVMIMAVGCNLNPLSKVVEEVAVEESTEELTEEPSIEVSEEKETEEEMTEEKIIDENFMKTVETKTMWIQKMTAAEAALSSIWGNEYAEDSMATVVGLWLEDVEGAEAFNDYSIGVDFYRMENEEYVEMEEYTIHHSTAICGHNRAIVIARFPEGKVDVNNLYMRIYDSYGDSDRYFKVDAENTMDIYSLEASEEIIAKPGEIMYFHDIPFIVTDCNWNSYTNPFDYENDNLDFKIYPSKIEDFDYIERERTITLMPLNGQIFFDFSFTDTTKISDNYDTKDYAIAYAVVADRDRGDEDTIEGNRLKYCIELRWYYDREAYEAAREDDYYASDFLDRQYEKMGESDAEGNTYLIFENEHHPVTKMYIFQSEE